MARKFSINSIVPKTVTMLGKNVSKIYFENKQVWPTEQWKTIIDMATAPSLNHGTKTSSMYSGKLLSYANTAVNLFDGSELEVTFEAQYVNADSCSTDWRNLFAFGVHINEAGKENPTWTISAFAAPTTDKKWHSYRIYCDGSIIYLYIDNSLNRTDAVTNSMRTQNGMYFFGGGYHGELTGNIKNLLVKKR